MKNFEIEVAKRRLTGMVKVKLFGGGIHYVNISDIAVQANRKVRIANQRYYQSAVWKIEKE